MAIPTTTREYHLPNPGGLKSLVLEENPVRMRKSSEVLVKVHAVSLQFRDLLINRGLYPMALKENVVVCSDMAGEILGIGDDVKGWNIGDRICSNFAIEHLSGNISTKTFHSALGGPIDGVLTEYKLVPAHSLVRIPAHLSYEEASTLPCAALTAYSALFGPVPVKGGDTVLIQGTGGVSIFALQFAVACGATVIVTSSSDVKLQVASQLGAKHLINYMTTPDWEQEVLRLTDGRGVDHIIEVGGAGTLAKSVTAVAYGGWISVIGVVAGVRLALWELPHNVPYEAKTRLYEEFLASWVSPARVCFERIAEVLLEFVNLKITAHFGRFQALEQHFGYVFSHPR
ncbi:hypothetical protein B0H21DRAFT_693184 [Amylocystis lapponica]|nr:hypothetical protein B0H21DRAFT_693184 [Amylocystis lapponica]